MSPAALSPRSPISRRLRRGAICLAAVAFAAVVAVRPVPVGAASPGTAGTGSAAGTVTAGSSWTNPEHASPFVAGASETQRPRIVSATHFTVAPHSITDSQGTIWQPSSGAVGGVVTSTTGGIGATGSPALYQWSRLGITSWTVPVPAAGTYSLDILICDTTNAAIGARVFSVAAGDGITSTTLASRLDPNALVNGWHPYHLTGLVTVAKTSLTVSFGAIVGQPIVSGIAVLPATQPSHVTLDQTFAGAAGTAPDPSVWSYETGTGWEGSMGLEDYTTSRANSQLDGSGDLAITARATGPLAYTSARLVTKGKFSFSYGTISARMQMPTGVGMWPAFWALGTDESTVNWPACGEIDVVEGLGSRPAVVAGHVHSLGNTNDPVGYLDQHISTLGTDWTSSANTTSGFHTYTAYYRPGSITFTFDGTPYYVATPEDLLAGEAWPFTGAPNYLLLNLAVGNSNWTGYAPAEPVGTAHTLLVNAITVTQ